MTVDVLAALPQDVQQRILAQAGQGRPAAAPSAAAPADTDPMAIQLRSERFPLNAEQQQAVDAVVGRGLNTVIRAKAGTGKTSTLEALARRLQIARPGARILYIAFNRSVKLEAEARMPSNVEARTGHSLAWNAVGLKLAGKMSRSQLATAYPEIASSDEVKYLRSRPAAIGKALGLSPEGGETVRMIVDAFAISDSEVLGTEHLEAVATAREIPDDDHIRKELLSAARQYWDDICTPLGNGLCTFAATSDHLRKIWSLSGPNFMKEGSGAYRPADILFVDEAQDTPPVLSRVIEMQPDQMQRVVVGDADQAIYGFAGSRDYLSDVAPAMQADLPLTTSYRFGDRIANVANCFLEALGSDELVRGDRDHDYVGRVRNADAVLTRTNAGMIEEIIRESAAGRRVGLLSETRNDLIGLIQTTHHLRDKGPKPEIWHRILSKYTSWNDVLAEADQALGITELTVALGIVESRTLAELSDIAHGAVEVVDAKRANCDVVVVTAHKAKGLEWPSVRIGEDFYGPNRKPPRASNTDYDDPEYLRLGYVAVTRAQERLDLGSLAWILKYDGRRWPGGQK